MTRPGHSERCRRTNRILQRSVARDRGRDFIESLGFLPRFALARERISALCLPVFVQ